MKNNLSLKLISMLAVASMLLSLTSCNGTDKPNDTLPHDTSATLDPYSSQLSISHTIGEAAEEGPTVTEYSYTGAADEVYFTLSENSTVKDGNVTFPAKTVSSLSFSRSFSPSKPVSYEMTARVVTDPTPSSALFIGFRLSSPTSDATVKGVWTAIKGNKIGLRDKSWPNAQYISLGNGIDFSKPTKLYITDDPASNTITFFTDNENGEKTEFAKYVIENQTVKIYTPDRDKPRKTINLGYEIPSTGYTNIWAHYTPESSSVSGVKITGSDDENKKVTAANMMVSRDIFEDTWVSTDNEGRLTVQDEKTPGEKKVGIFYFLWHDGTTSQPIYDHSAAYYSGGVEKLKNVMKQGPMGFAHYWAEPYFGYYRSDDEWVLRKHANQLTSAGVDFVFFDFTNGYIYERNLEKLLSVWNQMRIEGQKVPQVAFHIGNSVDYAKKSFSSLNALLFSNNRYEDMWFKWDGKPLVLGTADYIKTLPAEVTEKFSFKYSWADTNGTWYMKNRGKDCWPWADMYPQKPGLSQSGEIDQMIVMCGFWANSTIRKTAGRSFSNNKQPLGDPKEFSFDRTYKTSGKGLAFEEQFDYAIEKDPELIMLTGWNEWWAGRWEAGAAVGQTIAGSYTVTENDPLTKNYYVDCFSPEFSRDIEPVKGLFNDNYYYQMAQNIRSFKGTRSLQTAFGQKTVDINGSIAQWYSVGPEYRDHIGDTAHRDAMSYVGQLHYTNNSGRNDFINAKVSSDSDSFYFMAECDANITAAEGTNWMNLFIDSDANAATGWSGYDYVINRSQNGNKCSVEKFESKEWTPVSIGDAEFSVNGEYIVIKLPKNTVALGTTFDFKWADNSVSDGDAMQFVDQGDTAPSDRFNYRFTTEAQSSKKPEILTDSMIVLKAGSYNAYVNGNTVMLDESNTNAVMLGTDNEIYIPGAFAKDKLGIDTSSMQTFNHYGTEYVEIGSVVGTLGKTVTKGEGIVVLSENTMTENELITLYRSLY